MILSKVYIKHAHICICTHHIHTYVHIFMNYQQYFCVCFDNEKVNHTNCHIFQRRKRRKNNKLYVTTEKKILLDCNVVSLVREHCYFESHNQLNQVNICPN